MTTLPRSRRKATKRAWALIPERSCSIPAPRKPAGWGLWTFTEFGEISGDLNARYRDEFNAGTLTAAEYSRWAADLINATLGGK